MTWLKKVVQVVARVLPYILGGGALYQTYGLPGSSTIVPKVLGDLNAIPQIIATTELLFNNVNSAPSGPDKLKAAAPLVQQLIIDYATNHLPGAAKLKDPAKLAAAANQITSGFADALNAFE
jgi:hypothetical protein